MQNYDFKSDFPIFQNAKPYGKDLVYLDNAASAQKPLYVINAMRQNMEYEYANIHRGVHYLANKSTIAFENARSTIANFIGAKDINEIIFTTGATEGLNLLASSLGQNLVSGDEVILSIAEHHSNIVPWHFLRKEKNIVIKWVNILQNGEIDLEHYNSLLSPKTKIVSITHISNVLGKINPIKQMAKMAKEYGALFITDGSQGLVHLPLNVNDLGIDFYVATGHKLYAPTGSGFVWGRIELLNIMPPYKGGGEMIETVTKDNVTYNTPPHRFEAGTPAITQNIGLGAAIEYLEKFNRNDIFESEIALTAYCYNKLSEIDEIVIYGDQHNRMSVITFNINNIHPHDIATYIDRLGIAVRAGHHCASPLMNHLGVTASLRASLGIYNDKNDIDILCDGLKRAVKFFA